MLIILVPRFGIVFVTEDQGKELDENNPVAALLRAFSFIKGDANNKEAFHFISKVNIIFMFYID